MTLDWSPLAIATVVLACVAVWSILQTRGLQRSEKRQRLLNEVIEWAIDIRQCGIVSASSEATRLARLDSSLSLEAGETVKIASLRYEFEVLKARSEYIRRIALATPQDLHSAVREAIEALERHITVISQWFTGEVKSDAIGIDRVNLNKSANDVIEEAVKLKTKDIA